MAQVSETLRRIVTDNHEVNSNNGSLTDNMSHISPDARDLLARMMHTNVTKRISLSGEHCYFPTSVSNLSDALRHPFIVNHRRYVHNAPASTLSSDSGRYSMKTSTFSVMIR